MIPSGTVTFLFTDIEGSTKLAQKFPRFYESRLLEHDSILKETIEAYGGYQFRKVGDAICASFLNASDAVNAAVESQRKLNAEGNKEFRIKVRMGIHTGQAEYQGGDYLGYLTLTRASRVMSVAYGGQILLTQDTFKNINGMLPENVSLRDMGERRLKDLFRPERIHQIVTSGLENDFPALKTLDERLNNLPIQLTSFVGREEEIRQIRNLFNSTRLLTLTGTGGVGKTRLAIHIAADLTDDFSDGVWFADLASLSEESLILLTLFRSLRVKEDPNQTLEESLLNYLRNKEVLIIFDNCEHLIDASARLTEKLLSVCPKLKIIATSREALKCSGEQTHLVLSLAIPDPNEKVTSEILSQYESAKLFIDRAKTLNPSFKINNDNAPALAEICYQLDGIPLALELAAARTNVLSVEKINERLSNRFHLLSGGKRTAIPKQQTLKALIDWSHNLLSESEKILFRRLTVFSRGWSLEAAEQVCPHEKLSVEDILDMLSLLHDKSLIIYDKEQERYQMLESIRQYGDDQLNISGEKIPMKKNHFNYFLQMADESVTKLSGSSQKEWINKLETEYSNFQSALYFIMEEQQFESAAKLATGIGRYLEIRGYITEAKRWFKDILEGKDEINPLQRSNVLNWAGTFEWISGDFPAATHFYEESLRIRKQIGDKQGIANTLNNLGLVAIAQDESEIGINLLEEGLKVFKEVSDKPLIADALLNLGSALAKYNINDKGTSVLTESLDIYRELGDKRGMSMALHNLGSLANYDLDYTLGQSLYEECLVLQKELGDRRGVALTLNNLGALISYQGKSVEAEDILEQSVILHREVEDKAGLANALNNLGFIKFNLGKNETALNLQREGLTLRNLMGNSEASYSIIGIAEGLSIKFPDRATMLLGAMDKIFHPLDQILETEIKAVYDKTILTLKETLGAAHFMKHFNEGKKLNLEKAIELALKV